MLRPVVKFHEASTPKLTMFWLISISTMLQIFIDEEILLTGNYHSTPIFCLTKGKTNCSGTPATLLLDCISVVVKKIFGLKIFKPV